jgi:hypothetical protein
MTRLTLITLCVLLAACGKSEPSWGDKVAARGEQWERVGQDWNDGKALIAEGTEQAAAGQEAWREGQDLMNQGSRDMEDGNAKIVKGQALVRAAEDYMQRYGR